MRKRLLTTLAVTLSIGLVGATAAIGSQRGAESGRGSLPSPNGITGRVLDPSGAPVKGTFVTALRPAPERPSGFAPVSVQLKTETDEQGTFVLDGLALGEYYVIAVPRNPAFDAAGRRSRRASTRHLLPALPRERVAPAARGRVRHLRRHGRRDGREHRERTSCADSDGPR
jgi:hypothetical protein